MISITRSRRLFALLLLRANQATLDDGDDDSARMAHRARLLERLESTPGRHLVLVRYAPGHSTHAEWVQNGADIDGARVVWARALDPARDRRLRAYFRDRRAWLIAPEDARAELVPYPGAPTLGGGSGTQPAPESVRR